MTPAPRGARAILAGVPVVVGAAALFVLYAWLATRNTRVGFLADDALYLLMAEMYSPYRDALGAVYDHVRQYSHLPPLYPWLLGLAGAGPDQLQAARLANAGCMTLAWLICHGWLRARGVPWAMASALCLFCALTPATLLYVVDLWSEGLFILLVLLALGVEQALPRRPSLVALLGLGVLVACAMQTRSIGVALVPAVLLGCARRGTRAVVVTLLALGATLAAFAPLDMGSAAPSHRELMHNHYAGDPGAAVARELPAALRYDLFFARGVTSWQIPIHALMLILVARGAWLELRARSVLAVYLLGYPAIAFSWPFPEQTDRFLYPLLPLLAYALWRGSHFSRAGRAVALVATWLPLLLARADAGAGRRVRVLPHQSLLARCVPRRRHPAGAGEARRARARRASGCAARPGRSMRVHDEHADGLAARPAAELRATATGPHAGGSAVVLPLLPAERRHAARPAGLLPAGRLAAHRQGPRARASGRTRSGVTTGRVADACEMNDRTPAASGAESGKSWHERIA